MLLLRRLQIPLVRFGWTLRIVLFLLLCSQCGYPGLAEANQSGAQKKPGEILENSLEMKFAFIPAGKFMMGSPASEEFRHPDEEPVEVTISKDFYLGVYEVSQFECKQVLVNWDNPSVYISNALPVQDLSWKEAESFCAHLSALDAERKAGRSYRLPTEAEWEYACRAGTTTAYYFGDSVDQLDKHAWTNTNSGGKPHPAGDKLPNPWGLYDMYGNLMEMTSCLYGDYRSQPSIDPQGVKWAPPISPSLRDLGVKDTSSAKPVARGGAYFGNRLFSDGSYRSARRTQVTLSQRPDVGFRVVMVVADPQASKP